MSRPTVLERAFEMAGTGDYAGMGEIRAALQVEGYSTKQVVGRSLQQQLLALCQKARGIEPPLARFHKRGRPANPQRTTYFQKLTGP